MRNGRVETSNLPWVIEQSRLAKQIHLPATCSSTISKPAPGASARSDASDLVALNHVSGPADRQSGGDRARNRPRRSRTFLGWKPASRFRLRRRPHRFWSAGRFADRTAALPARRRFGHVSYERILSGPGLVNVYEFLRDSGCGEGIRRVCRDPQEQRPRRRDFARRAGRHTTPLAEKALDIVDRGLRRGGRAIWRSRPWPPEALFLAGGISPKILAKLTGPLFMQSFLEKGRLRSAGRSDPRAGRHQRQSRTAGRSPLRRRPRQRLIDGYARRVVMPMKMDKRMQM